VNAISIVFCNATTCSMVDRYVPLLPISSEKISKFPLNLIFTYQISHGHISEYGTYQGIDTVLRHTNNISKIYIYREVISEKSSN
jgi:hypothetical protein